MTIGPEGHIRAFASDKNCGGVVKIGKLPVSLGVLGKYWVEKPDSAPDWGIRFEMTFMFPK